MLLKTHLSTSALMFRASAKVTRVLLTLCLLTAGLGSADTTLHDYYLLALKSDPTTKAAHATYKSSKAAVMISASALLPHITYVDSDIDTKIQIGTSTLDTNNSSKTFQGSLKIFDPTAWFTLGQSRNLSKAEHYNFIAQQQNLILRLTNAYLNTLTVTGSLKVAQTEALAFQRQYERVYEQFQAGVVNITETHEAQLQYDLARVRLIEAVGQVEITRQSLAEIVGNTPSELIAISDEYPAQMPEPRERIKWVEVALSNSPELNATSQLTRAARSAKQASLARNLPVVELVASKSESSSYNFGVGGILNTDSDSMGVRITVPIISGFGDIARGHKASYDHQAARYREEAARRATIRNTRSQHQQVETALGALKARNQAVLSAQSAFESTEVGYEVGTRNIVDLLNAQRQLYAAQRDSIAAKHQFIYSVFRLKALTGALSPQDVIDLSLWQK